MTPSLSPAVNQFLNGLARLQDTVTSATSRLSSGYKINQPSDAPDLISPLLDLQARQRHNEVKVSNLSRVQLEVSTADQAVSSALQLLDAARTLGAQGANGTTSDATRAGLAQQVQSLQSQLVALSNTNAAGRYVFSGDDDSSPAYRLNLSQAPSDPQNGVDRLITAPMSAARQIELVGHSFLSVDQSAQDLFDHRNADDTLATDNVFAALNSLRIALATPDNQAGIITAQASVQAAADYLNSKQSAYGTVQNRITTAVSQRKSGIVDLKQQISALRETDIVQTALELTAAETQTQAAMAAEAKIPHTSLFDFLG